MTAPIKPASFRDFEPGRLWSLWDMQEFRADNLIHLARELGRLAEHLRAIPAGEVRPDGNKEHDKEIFEEYKTSFDKLGLQLCARQCQRIAERCCKPLFVSDYIQLLVELQNRMVDECELFNFISLTPDEAKLFAPPLPLFGNAVEDKLPQVIEDVAEAGKCLGVQRATAAVFHLMRVMEVGVQKLGDKLGVQLTEEKVWQVILDQVNAEIKKLGKTDFAKKSAAISAHLYNVKLAWRNEAMHPKATYTPEEATGIFSAVRQFMNELATIL